MAKVETVICRPYSEHEDWGPPDIGGISSPPWQPTRHEERQVLVMRRLLISADCSCGHCMMRGPREFEIIIPGGGKRHEMRMAYVRQAGFEHHFRESERNGPIEIRIDSLKTE